MYSVLTTTSEYYSHIIRVLVTIVMAVVTIVIFSFHFFLYYNILNHLSVPMELSVLKQTCKLCLYFLPKLLFSDISFYSYDSNLPVK